MRAPSSCCELPPLLLLLLLLASTASASAQEVRLLRDLRELHDPLVRPVRHDSEPLNVTMGVTINRIQVHPEQNEITVNMWVTLQWSDCFFMWDSEEYGNISDCRLPPSALWMPDIMPFNMLPRPESSWLAPTPVVVKSNGDIKYVGGASVRVVCKRDHTRDLSHNFLEVCNCDIKFGSWTYNSFQLDLSTEDSADFSSYIPNDAFWKLHDSSMEKNTITYACCPEPYVDVTLSLQLRRSASSAWPNLPVAVSVLTALAAFLVPVDSPQKLTLPCVSLLAAGSAAMTEFGLEGPAEYRTQFLLAYHVHTYMALAVLLWSVLLVLLGRPRALRLPPALRRLLTGCLASVCCLASPPDAERKELCGEWTALAELLDRLMFAVFLVLVIAGSLAG